MITGQTKVFGIIGWPVSHSLSPLMHNAAFAALSLDAVYVPFPVDPGCLGAAIEGFRASGIAGFSVTIPHKSTVISFLDEVTPEALETGAVNTVERRDRRLIGHNTDGAGLVRSLSGDLSFEPAGKRILILGTGGAARAALTSLARAGATYLAVAGRSRDKASDFLSSFPSRPNQVDAVALDILADSTSLRSFDLIVNATSVGMGGSSFEKLSFHGLSGQTAVYDMVYSPPVTPLLSAAANEALSCANGLGMLACQGEVAFQIWTSLAPPEGLMKRVLENRL